MAFDDALAGRIRPPNILASGSASEPSASMKRGWLHVETDALDDEGLTFWLGEALAYNAELDG